MPVNWDLCGQLLSRSALDPIGPFLPSQNLHKVELFSAFIIIRLRWYFKEEMFMKVQVSSIWKKKKIDMKDSRIRTHDPDGAVYYANH